VAKLVNTSLMHLVKPEDGLCVNSVHNLATHASGNFAPVSLYISTSELACYMQHRCVDCEILNSCKRKTVVLCGGTVESAFGVS